MYTEPMRKTRIKHKIQLYMIAFLMLILTGCKGNIDSTEVEGTQTIGVLETQQEDENSGDKFVNETKTKDREVVADMDLYLLVKWNTQEQKVRLYRYATGMEYEYRYGETTLLRNKYGDYAKLSDFVPGMVVHIGNIDPDGVLTKIQVAEEVWEYQEISSYSIDETREVFEMMESRYQWEQDLYVFSYDQRINIGDILKEDVIAVTGYGKTILSVRITQGQGTLELSNTELFEGSLLQLGTKIYKEITEDMSVSVPEGTYILSVANNGWGGSTEITINRGETTTLDLDTIKGSGPKYGKIHFVIDFPGAKLFIDGEKVDHYMLQRLVYGKHKITVEAPGYETWTRYLYVNSEEATIEIELVDDEEIVTSQSQEKDEEDDEDKDDEDKDDKDEDSQSESQKREEEKQEALEEYYTTLTDMIESMT